jgi:hypothetical protein
MNAFQSAASDAVEDLCANICRLSRSWLRTRDFVIPAQAGMKADGRMVFANVVCVCSRHPPVRKWRSCRFSSWFDKLTTNGHYKTGTTNLLCKQQYLRREQKLATQSLSRAFRLEFRCLVEFFRVARWQDHRVLARGAQHDGRRGVGQFLEHPKHGVEMFDIAYDDF